MIGALRALPEAEKALRFSPFERIAMMSFADRIRFVQTMPARLRDGFLAGWGGMARPAQVPPEGEWRVWLVMAGRGFGKTRTGAEWVLDMADGPGRRIALVGASEDEARAVMVEGPSGLLASAEPGMRPVWEPSIGRLSFPGETTAWIYSAANAEALRGPEHDFAWCDEVGKWAQAEASWDNLMFGLRRGASPRVVATTTPRTTALMRRIAAVPGVTITRGRTADNLALARSFVRHVTALYGGTRLGRQELDGELIEDVAGSLWPRDLIERCRSVPPQAEPGEGDQAEPGGGVVDAAPGGSDENHFGFCRLPLHHPSADGCCAAGSGSRQSPRLPTRLHPPPHLSMGRNFARVVVGVDPPVSAGGDACGIVVCGVVGEGDSRIGYVLADASVSGLRPERWARAVVHAAETWNADRVIVETNQGGEMVESVLRSVECRLPVRTAHARKGKAARAEPVASLFEQGKAKFAGAFPALEDELSGMTIGGGYEGPGRSPDRADAMVWAMTELMLAERREVRITFF